MVCREGERGSVLVEGFSPDSLVRNVRPSSHALCLPFPLRLLFPTLHPPVLAPAPITFKIRCRHNHRRGLIPARVTEFILDLICPRLLPRFQPWRGPEAATTLGNAVVQPEFAGSPIPRPSAATPRRLDWGLRRSSSTCRIRATYPAPSGLLAPGIVFGFSG